MRKQSNIMKQKKLKEQIILDIGFNSGVQWMVDMLQCVLHDKRINGDAFGEERITRVLAGVHERDRLYHEALSEGKEADVKQDQLDRELRDIYGDRLVPFSERHSYMKQTSYKKAKKGWTDD